MNITGGWLLLTVCVAVASVGALPSLDPNDKQTYCGHHITNTLAMFCKGRYLSMMDIVIKRGRNGDNDDDNDDDDRAFNGNHGDARGGSANEQGTNGGGGGGAGKPFGNAAGVDSTDDMLNGYLAVAIAQKHQLEDQFGAVSLLQQLHAMRNRGAASAAAAGGRHRRSSEQLQVYRGIADECCLRPCSVRTLLSYCRTPPKY